MHVLLAAAALVVASAAGTTSLSMPSPWGYRSCGPPVELSGLTKGSDWPLDAGFRMGSYGLWVLATTSDRGEEVLHEFSDKGMLESTVAPEGGALWQPVIKGSGGRSRKEVCQEDCVGHDSNPFTFEAFRAFRRGFVEFALHLYRSASP